ncbi:MAG: cysteine desulfurase [Rhizobiales bacterium]|nr:cysteine desulfurase [Hyphomicrobiales bacterium]
MTERVYLDWNATARLRPEARAAMAACLDEIGNPSSVHAEGRAARRMVEAARDAVAGLVGADAALVTFTSGGTEANMLALTPSIEAGSDKAPRERLMLSAIEHPSVLCGGRFQAETVEQIPVNENGVIELDALRERLGALTRSGIRRPLVSIMHANNETGTVQPVSEAADIVHEAGGFLHVDAVQSAGRIPCDIKTLKADLLTLSAHKLGGPKGVGALLRRTDALHFPNPLIKGGGQERGLRAGTENVAGIGGFGAAAQAASVLLGEEGPRLSALRERLETGLKTICPDAVIFGTKGIRVTNTTLFSVRGVKAETALITLDLNGVAVSSGSACSSGKVQPSHVLAAMGVEPALARGAIRVSLGWASTARDIEIFLDAWKKLAESLGKVGRSIAA